MHPCRKIHGCERNYSILQTPSQHYGYTLHMHIHIKLQTHLRTTSGHTHSIMDTPTYYIRTFVWIHPLNYRHAYYICTHPLNYRHTYYIRTYIRMDTPKLTTLWTHPLYYRHTHYIWTHPHSLHHGHTHSIIDTLTTYGHTHTH